MSCRHEPGDPRCTSGNSPSGIVSRSQQAIERARADIKRWGPVAAALDPSFSGLTLTKEAASQFASSDTPDPRDYEVLDTAEFINQTHVLVLMVRYPSCARCSYEGVKVMVYRGVGCRDAIRWKSIDPHFRDDTGVNLAPTVAPSPYARFHGSDEGWEAALEFGQSLSMKKLE